MTFQTLFLVAVVIAFASLGATLFAVAWWSSLPARPARSPAAQARVPARRPEGALAAFGGKLQE